MDTSRNFVTVDVLKRIIDGLAASKVSAPCATPPVIKSSYGFIHA